MKTRRRYIPLHEARSGMALGGPIGVFEAGSVLFSLPVGHLLTEENLRNLQAHRVLLISITEADERSDVEIGQETTQVVWRLAKIFVGSNLADTCTSDLINRVLSYRIR